MTDGSLQTTIEDDYETELSRLGSSKALYALTGGDMDTEAVLGELAARAATAAETFEDWTDDDQYGEAFEAAAEGARGHADRIAETADDVEPTEPTDEPTPPDEVLRGLDGSDARLGGLLAWALLTDRILSQAVGFFVGNADPTAADLFRDLRSDVDGRREEALERSSSADADAARDAASRVVEAAYAHYVETLSSMGVKVKPVC